MGFSNNNEDIRNKNKRWYLGKFKKIKKSKIKKLKKLKKLLIFLYNKLTIIM